MVSLTSLTTRAPVVYDWTGFDTRVSSSPVGVTSVSFHLLSGRLSHLNTDTIETTTTGMSKGRSELRTLKRTSHLRTSTDVSPVFGTSRRRGRGVDTDSPVFCRLTLFVISTNSTEDSSSTSGRTHGASSGIVTGVVGLVCLSLCTRVRLTLGRSNVSATPTKDCPDTTCTVSHSIGRFLHF